MANIQKTLYVGQLPDDVTEELLLGIFGTIVKCTSCKIKRDLGDPYAFIDFQTHSDAKFALENFNKRMLSGKEMKVNWASSPATQQIKTDPSSATSDAEGAIKRARTSVRMSPYAKPTVAGKTGTANEEHFHIFVGDLGQEIEPQHLIEAFRAFGDLTDVKIIKDPQSNKSKGYGFVSFIKKEDAEKAIRTMNGQWIGSRAIRTNWATRKPPNPNQKEAAAPKSFEEVNKQASVTNTTVYVGGFDKPNLLAGSASCAPHLLNRDNKESLFPFPEELLHKHFGEFGPIQEIRLFKEKGYAFIRFAEHAQATQAIVAMHAKEIEGCAMKCSWGRESGDPNNLANQQQQQALASQMSGQYPYYGANMYWPFGQAAATQYGQVPPSAPGYVQAGVGVGGSQWPPSPYNYQMTYNPAVNVAAMASYGMQMPGAASQQAQFNGTPIMGYQMQQGNNPPQSQQPSNE